MLGEETVPPALITAKGLHDQQVVELIALLGEVGPLDVGSNAPPPERFVEVEHRDIAEVGHACDCLQEPEALNRAVLKEPVKGSAQNEIGYLDKERGFHGLTGVFPAPDGRVVERVSVPARKVSAVTFGGPEYRDVYITTALPEDADRSIEGDGGGRLYRADLGVPGVPEFRSAVGL